MVDFAHDGWSVAAGVGAVFVAVDHGSSQLVFHQASFSAEVEWLVLGSEDHRQDFRVAGELADGVGGDAGAGVADPESGEDPGEDEEVDRDHQGRTAAVCDLWSVVDGGGAEADLHSLVHGVLSLEQTERSYGASRRRLRVAKMRGTDYQSGWHDFALVTGEVLVFPSLIAEEHKGPPAQGAVSSGLAALDELLGVGLGSFDELLGDVDDPTQIDPWPPFGEDSPTGTVA